MRVPMEGRGGDGVPPELVLEVTMDHQTRVTCPLREQQALLCLLTSPLGETFETQGPARSSPLCIVNR